MTGQLSCFFFVSAIKICHQYPANDEHAPESRRNQAHHRAKVGAFEVEAGDAINLTASDRAEHI